MLLRRIFGPESQELTGGWRKLHHGNLLYSLPFIMMTKSRADWLSRQHSQDRTNIHGFGMNPLEKIPLGRPSHILTDLWQIHLVHTIRISVGLL